LYFGVGWFQKKARELNDLHSNLQGLILAARDAILPATNILEVHIMAIVTIFPVFTRQRIAH
jgi:hypothetical protein